MSDTDAEKPAEVCVLPSKELRKEVITVRRENTQLRVALFALFSGAMLATFATSWGKNDDTVPDRHTEQSAVEIHQRLQIKQLKDGIERLLEERKMRMLEQGEAEESMIEKIPKSVPFRGRREPMKA